MEQLGRFFLDFIDHAGYAGLFVVMALGNMGIPVGTEFVVPAAGALAASGHLSSLWLAALVATAGEVVGGGVLYAVGAYGGRPALLRFGKYVGVSEHKLDWLDRFFDRHGTKTVFFCRFIPVIRGISAFPAGISRMPKGVFFAYTAAGSAIFCFGLAWLGSLFGKHIDQLGPTLHRFNVVIVIAIGLAVIAFVILQTVRARRRARELA